MSNTDQKREYDGKYASDGNLDRLCVCGHMLGRHSCGSPSDCLYYSLSKTEQEQANVHFSCGVEKGDDNG